MLVWMLVASAMAARGEPTLYAAIGPSIDWATAARAERFITKATKDGANPLLVIISIATLATLAHIRAHLARCTTVVLPCVWACAPGPPVRVVPAFTPPARQNAAVHARG